MSTNNVPYQFYLPEALRKKAIRKLGSSGMDLASFMRMSVEQFVERPLVDSMALLEKHHSAKRKKKREKEK